MDGAQMIPEINTLDLTSNNVLAHFAKSTQNVQLLNFLLELDRVDRWTVDYNESESPKALEIKLFINELECIVKASLQVLHHAPQEFIDILCQLTTTRCMYLMRFVGQHNEEFLGSLGVLMEKEAGQSISFTVVKRRLEAFNRANLLGEIFSGKRLTRILHIMGSYTDV